MKPETSSVWLFATTKETIKEIKMFIGGGRKIEILSPVGLLLFNIQHPEELASFAGVYNTIRPYGVRTRHFTHCVYIFFTGT